VSCVWSQREFGSPAAMILSLVHADPAGNLYMDDCKFLQALVAHL
jgi:hypothetical protein